MKMKTCFGIAIWFALLAVIAGASQLSLKSEKYVDVSFLDAQSNDDAFVFFGFKECHGVCPTTMLSLRKLYLSEDSVKMLPSVFFVDIDRDSNLIQAQEYARQFHQDFYAHFPSDKEFEQLSDEFGLNITMKGDAIRHRGYLYYLKRESGRWRIEETLPPKLVSTGFLEDKVLKNLSEKNSISLAFK